ncbi:MAG: TIGR04255 family protein [Vicinamibacterales bacterium]
MATPRVLSRPPIFEALVDIRADAPDAPHAFDELYELLKGEFPTKAVRREIKAELKFEGTQLVTPQAQDLGPHGLHLSSADGSLIVQFRRDGFTLNNLKTYVGGDALLTRALSLWEIFVSKTKVNAPGRIAIRFINRLELPFNQGDDFSKFLVAPPDLPEPLPQLFNEFISRIVATDGKAGSPVMVVTRSLANDEGRPVILIDLDTIKMGPFPSSSPDLLGHFRELKQMGVAGFFALITEEAVRLYQ